MHKPPKPPKPPNPNPQPESFGSYPDSLKKLIRFIINTNLANGENWIISTGFTDTTFKSVKPSEIYFQENLLVVIPPGQSYPSTTIPLCNIQWIKFSILNKEYNIKDFNARLRHVFPPQQVCRDNKCSYNNDLITLYQFYQREYRDETIYFDIFTLSPYIGGDGFVGALITHDCIVGVFQTKTEENDTYIPYVLVNLNGISYADFLDSAFLWRMD